MNRPHYEKLELKKMTADEITAVASPQAKADALKATKKVFDVKMKRRPDESGGEFLQRQRKATEINKVEFPKLLRVNLESEVYNSKHNQDQAKLDKQFAAWRSTPEEKAALDARMAERERRHRMAEMEGGRSYTAGPVAMPAEWVGEAPAKAAPAPAPRAATNPTRPGPTRKSRK